MSMDNSPKRSQAMASDTPISSSNASGAARANADDAILNAVFDRIHRDLSFISHHHPHLSVSGDELSVWAKAIARQLTTQPLMGSDKKDVMH